MSTPTEPPPPFGHKLRPYFGFEAGYINLNNGSYGSMPKSVSAATEAISRSIQGNTDRFVKLHLAECLNLARHRMAKFLGAGPEEIVFVSSISHGLNTVLRNFLWNNGDIIITATTTYNAIERTVRYIADLPPHPSVSAFELKFPTTRASVLQAFRAHLDALTAELQIAQRKIGNGTKLKIVAVIDSIASKPGVYLPWKEMVALCRERNILTVIDAAHSIGQEPNINLSEVGPDFWVSCCYKWLYAHCPCAVLYAPIRNQQLIQSPFPTPYSYVSPKEPPKGPEDFGGLSHFVKMLQWTSFTDYSIYLSIHPALDFRQWLGGEQKINDHCRSLALSGGKRLSELLGTSLLDPMGEFTLNMTNVELPLAPSTPNNDNTFGFLSHNLLEVWRVSAAVFWHNGKWWVRVSAQVWNEISDFEHLAKALKDSCEKLDRKYQRKAKGKL